MKTELTRERVIQGLQRPKSAASVVQGIHNLEEFGRAIRDWQHELLLITRRRVFQEQIQNPPAKLLHRFKGGDIADAYLAGYTAYLADKAGVDRPRWTCSMDRVAAKPWFSHTDRARLLVTTPSPLREHNIFTDPENVVRIRKGRPRKTAEEIRRSNANRQRRYRQRRTEEFRRLRAWAAQAGSTPIGGNPRKSF